MNDTIDHIARMRMKLLTRVISGFVVVLLASCGGQGSPTSTNDTPADVAFQVTSGVFDVTANKILDECDSKTVYGGAYEIQIDGGSFSMGGEWTGSWDANIALGHGESVHEKETFRACTVTSWTSVNVTFQSEDEFAGSISFTRRVSGECNTPCITTWGISGIRQHAAP